MVSGALAGLPAPWSLMPSTLSSRVAGVHPRRQRGSAMLVALIALTALVTLGGLTVLSVQGGIAAAGAERQKLVALYAAESGAAAAMVALRQNLSNVDGWTAYVKVAPEPLTIIGAGAQPGTTGSVISADVRGWYQVKIINNPDDAGNNLVTGTIADTDNRVIIVATGHGPGGVTAQVEWQVAAYVATGSRPCPGYGQKGMAEDGAGRNDCLTTIISTDVATYSPGGP